MKVSGKFNEMKKRQKNLANSKKSRIFALQILNEV
jgi:hypothetical protein